MNHKKFPSIIVVIVNWCRAMDTIECIQSVIHNGVDVGQILVIDNGSKDDSVEQINHIFPDIDIHQLNDNLGFTGGYNYGIESALKSGAEKVLLLNNDTILDINAIQALYSSEWDVGVPKIYFHNSPNILWSVGALWRRFPPMVVIRGYKRKDTPRYNQPLELNSATACALMIKKEVFEKVGSFDRDFINYFEDYDFIYRVRKAGFRVGIVPEAKVWHKISLTLGENSPEKYWYLGRNCVLFYRKGNRFPNWAFYSFITWVTGRELLKLNFEGILNFWRGVQDGMKWMKYGNSSL